MAFLIFLGFLGLVLIIFFIGQTMKHGVDEAVGSTLFATIGLAMLGGLITAMSMTIVPITESRVVESKTYSLTALNTGSETRGRFFLGSGTVSGNRTLNYILNDNGAYTVESVGANRAVIYQDSTEPTLIVSSVEEYNPAIFPFSISSKERYDFHIPENSILSDYTIDNG